MKMEDYKMSIEELENEFAKNEDYITINKKKATVAELNQFEHKFIISSSFAMVSYIILFIISLATSIFPPISIPAITIGGAIGTGIISKIIMESKYKMKKKLREFSNAKKESEKLEEEIKYTIELKKINNRNNSIKQTINFLNSNQLILNALYNRYDIKDKNVSMSFESAKSKVEELLKLLEQKNNELDILSTQKVLHNRFWRLREQGTKIMDTIIITMFGGIITLCYIGMPFFLVKDVISITLPMFFSTWIAITTGIGAYMLKRNKDRQKVFNIINSKLGKYALPNKIKDAYSEEKEIDAKIETKTSEIRITRIHLQEQKRILESFYINKNNKIIESLFTMENTIKNNKNIDTKTDSQEILPSFIKENTYSKEEKEKQSEKNGPSLVLKK